MEKERCKEILEKSLQRIEYNTTLELSFLEDDFLIHFAPEGLFSDTWKVVDLWELSEGQSALITNRVEDLPVWFELTPYDTGDFGMYSMLEAIRNGRGSKEDQMDGPSIWRPESGHYLIWVGKSRDGQAAVDGILRVLYFDENAIVIGQNSTKIEETDFSESNDAWKDLFFGAVKDYSKISARAKTNLLNAKKIMDYVGSPRSISTGWTFG